MFQERLCYLDKRAQYMYRALAKALVNERVEGRHDAPRTGKQLRVETGSTGNVTASTAYLPITI